MAACAYNLFVCVLGALVSGKSVCLCDKSTKCNNMHGATVKVKVKVKVKQSLYRPGQAQRGSRRLRLPDFKTIGT